MNKENSHITASIRQASSTYKFLTTDISAVEIGNTVEGVISDVQKDKILITLDPTQVRALLSLKNLANRRGVSASQLQASLSIGDTLQDLVVTSRNQEKGFVLVATRPKGKEPFQKGSVSLDTVAPGDIVGGRVIRHVKQGAVVKLTGSIVGYLHPTDAGDDFEAGRPFPTVDTILRATVLDVDKEKRRFVLSTRPSRMHPDQKLPVSDREIGSVDDLQEGQMIRGFIKSVAQHGLFVTLGRNVDARVQIKELFDEVSQFRAPFKGCIAKTFSTVCQGLAKSILGEPAGQRTHSKVGTMTVSCPALFTDDDLALIGKESKWK